MLVSGRGSWKENKQGKHAALRWSLSTPSRHPQRGARAAMDAGMTPRSWWSRKEPPNVLDVL